MSVTALDIAKALSDLGVRYVEQFSTGSIYWEIWLRNERYTRIDLSEAGGLLTACSSYSVNAAELTEQARLPLLERALQRNEKLQIGHYELNGGFIVFRAVLPIEDSEITQNLLERWLRSVVAESCLFGMESLRRIISSPSA